MRKNKGGGTLSKVHDRSCTRRTRKRAHQAGCPDLDNGCHCHVESERLVQAFNRFAYAVRVNKVSKGLLKALRPMFRPSKVPKSGLAGIPGRPSVSFVKAKQSDAAYSKPLDYKPRLRTSRLSRVGSIPLVGYDDRVADTSLEASSARLYRAAWARRGDHVLPTSDDLRTRLLTVGESARLRSDPEFVQIAKSQAWPDDFKLVMRSWPRLCFGRVKASTAVLTTFTAMLRDNKPVERARSLFIPDFVTYRLPGL